jgi:hypothetical protein
MRAISTVGVILGAVAIATSGGARLAFGQGGACYGLQQQYLSALQGQGSGAGANDAASLSRSLAAAEQAANTNHCMSLGIFSPKPTPACPAIMSQINQLQSSLRQASGGTSRGLFGFVSYARSPADQARDALATNGCEIPDLAGGSRTLCVRTCDGYYFPVSSGIGSNQYAVDAQFCQATYGDQRKPELFVTSLDGDVADARTLTGKRYGDQPYAFSYRSQFNPACVAQLQNGIATLAALTPSGVSAPGVVDRTDVVPIPQLRPRQSEDPETLRNTAGRLQPQPLLVRPAGAGPRGMRVVGADYYNLILQQQAVAPAHIGNAVSGQPKP